MSARAYVLLHIVDGNSEWVLQALRSMPGVVTVDVLEGPPDVIMVVEASERQKLAELTTQALASVETAIEDMRLLPSRDD